MPRGNFLAQFSGPKPDPVAWGLEIKESSEALIMTVYMTEDFEDSLDLVKRLRKIHPTVDISITAQHLG